MADMQDQVDDPNDPSFDRDRYWRVVTRTVRDVFQADPGRVERVRTRLASQSRGTQEKFYQTEPYTVAADIAEIEGAGTQEQQHNYMWIKRTEGFGQVESPELSESRFYS